MKRYLKRRWFLFVMTVAITILSDLILTVETVLHQRLIDSVMAVDTAGVWREMFFVIGGALLAGAVYVAANVCQDLFSARLADDMRCEIFAGILGRSQRDFGQVNSSDYVSALTNDLQTIRSRYLGMLFMVVIFGAGMFFSAALMLYYQPVVAAAALMCAAIMTLVPAALGKRLGKWERARSEKLAGLTTCLTELFSGFQVISSFGIKKHALEKFRACSRDLKTAEYQADGLSAFSDGLAQLLSSVAQSAILVLACYMVFRGRMTIGALVAFISLNQSFCSGLSMVLRCIPMIRGVKPVIDRVNALADSPGRSGQGREKPTFDRSLTVKELSFGYRDGEPVLDHACMTLVPGGKYALTGESGSGKTTLIRLLSGELEGYGGGIYYDGRELGSLNPEGLNGVLAVIHQEVFLFDDTIRNNICLFDEFTDEEFDRAVRLSGVGKFLQDLPGGGDYPVGQGGRFLSGGQRQRVAIARALIRNTRFLILDEGTSALDERTAGDIEAELMTIGNLTLLTITHHLKPDHGYDGVFELKDGNVVFT